MKVAPPKALAELQRWPHWVVWREEERDGKPTKVPYQARYPERRASSTDPSTWATHAAAKSALAQGKGDGLGYVFAEDDEYAGVDLDHCVVDGKVAFGARAIVDRLASYTELSPSGTGLHIIVRAGLNGGRNRTKTTSWDGDFETYDCGRFFTITGEHLPGTPTTIESRQEELDAIRAELFPASATANVALTNGKSPTPVTMDDYALEEKIRKSRSGAKFDRLMAGDTSGHGEDDSAADMALCNLLAWWLQGDAARMDAWFRRSGLYREKWEREDYRERTIAEGIASCANGFYNPKHNAKPVSLAEREQEFETAATELAAMCALEDDDEFVELWRTGNGTAFRYYLRTRKGAALDLDPLRSFTTAPKMNVEIASQLKTVPAIQAKDMPRFMALLGKACELRQEMTLDDRIQALMVSYVQEAPEHASVVDNDQQGRVATFRWLDRCDDPLGDARSATQVSRNAPIVLDPNTGLRFVRQTWFHAYVKHHLGGATVERLAGRVEMLGWMRRGRDGRIKATPTDGGKELFDHFYVIPVGWENGHD
jgi:primase-polymerase (primpol)-like protein